MKYQAWHAGNKFDTRHNMVSGVKYTPTHLRLRGPDGTIIPRPKGKDDEESIADDDEDDESNHPFYRFDMNYFEVLRQSQ
jgi:hypothetical protein